VILHYLRLVVWPVPLVFDYGWPRATTIAAIVPAALVMCTLFAATAAAVGRRHPIGFAGALGFLVLAPTSSVVPVLTEVAAEHRMYLPLAAVLGAIVAGVRRLGVRAAAIAIVGGALAVGAGSLTRARGRDYGSVERLWQTTVEARPANPRARLTYGIELLTQRRYREAEAQLRESVRLLPTSAPAELNLGIALCSQDRTLECLGHLETAAKLDPGAGEVFGLLGESYLELGQADLAVSSFLRALDLMPDSRAYRFLLGRVAWLLSTSPDAAVRDGARAVTIAERGVALSEGRDVAALDALAAAYAEADRFAEAETTLTRALALARDQHDAASLPQLETHLATVRAGQKIRSPH
jgi:tetratricopeptide (TPR) repeat protein